MADDKRGREKKARDAAKRQRERDVAAERERGAETEPALDAAELGDLEAALEDLEFPTTGAAIAEAVGDHTIETDAGNYAVAELVAETDGETFDAPDAVRVQVRRPTVAAAMKRVVEASETLPNAEFGWTQRNAYELTFRELEAIDASDDDKGITAIGDWIVERIHEKDALPSSRAVRRQAAKFCRANGYDVRVDDWLGI